MANNGDSLDVNSMYSILKNIFNRELNENYSNRNRSNFAGGLADLRNGWAAMQNARKNKQDQAEYKNGMGNGGGNQYPNGSIGATGDGIYGVNSMPPQPNGGGIGVDANGVYGVNGATPQPNKYTFNESDYIPSAQNGYHLGNYPQTEMYGSPADFQRQMASNAIGYNLGSFEPRQQTWFPKDNAGGNGFDWGKTSPMPKENSAMDAWKNQGGNSMFSGMSGGEKPDNTMNITSQTIGNNYNGRIDGQVGGLGIPQSPKGDGGFNSVFNVANANPYQPSISSSDVARGIGGQNVSANDLSRYLGNEYNRATWIQQDMANNGVTNPLISMLRYDTKVAPLINAAREDDMRNAFMTYNSKNATPEQKMNALAKLAYYTKTPDLADRIQRGHDNDMYRQGYVRDNSDVGNNILSTFKDYEEGEQWMSPDGTGDSRTQCSNFVSDVLRKVGLDIGSPNGDELMKQFGKAYHTGLDGIQAGDVLNFKDHVGFYVGNGQYIARNSSGGVHQGSMEEAIKNFGQPLGYASVREYATGVPRYRRDTSKESLLRQKHQYNLEEIEARNRYRNPKNGTTVDADGYIKGSGDRNNALIDGINWYANASERKPEDLMKKVVNPLSDVFVDKLVQFKNEGQALEQLAYELVGGEEYGSSGMSDEQLAEVIGEAAMKAGNNKRIRYQTSGKNAIKQKLLKDILPRLHGVTPQTDTGNGTPPSTEGKKATPLSGKAAGYDETAKGGSNKPKGKTKAEMQQDDPLMFSETGLTPQEEFRNKMTRPVDWGSIFHVTPDENRNENLTYKW